ncbi:MAG: hypothetical protein ABWK00_05605 [Desulfurococcaceae archaeon]
MAPSGLDALREELEKVFDKVVGERRGRRLELFVRRGDASYLVCAEAGERALFAKVVDASWGLADCGDALYDPRGLYAFSDDPRELARKVAEKAAMLSARGSGES